MPATRLTAHAVEKPWGRHILWPGFADPAPEAAPVGEIWFQGGQADAPLLVKYLFTGAPLSIQVHPDDAPARAAGHQHGKDEAWLVLAARPDSVIALGPARPTTAEALRAAARAGRIAGLLDWRAVKAGDLFYSPAGTIHAIGPGITLIEVQQNADLTYRLHNYDRPRPLQIEAGIAASNLRPLAEPPTPQIRSDRRTILIEGPQFVLERWSAGTHDAGPGDRPGWFIPIGGGGTIDGQAWRGGECWMTQGKTRIVLNPGGDALFAYPGTEALE